ncbi:ubiquitin carboxyl-terminal hydrolase isozyme L5 [Drosophila tropicalis]|uniref:ubiquitin carboxyl-terminal hydrolase isozyme L5 n=1 Tax=Drosophila tropicalis TaxID=46794 RepID=UPI0035ABC4D1
METNSSGSKEPQEQMPEANAQAQQQQQSQQQSQAIATGNEWCLIESDPGVFTELIREFGCVGAEVEEIWSLDAGAFYHLEPVHGLIFLFKWIENDEPAGRVVSPESEEGKGIFFAKQMVTNACATQAILSLLLNLQHEDIELGETLLQFKEMCQKCDPYKRGQNLGNSLKIRQVHNSFARPEIFDLDAIKQQSSLIEDDFYHFVGYMPIGNHLYELDGMQEGPIELGEIQEGQNWLDVVRPIIEARMNRYSVGEIHFNLMALVSDRQRSYERQIATLMKPGDTLLDGNLSETERMLEIADLQRLLDFELNKKRRYQRENLRRRHNYLPFILELLKQLGETGQLMPIYEKAKERSLMQANHQFSRLIAMPTDSNEESVKVETTPPPK